MRDLVCWAAAHIKDREDEVAQWKGYDAPSSLSSWGALKAGTSRFPPKSITLEKIPSSHSGCLCNHGHFKARNKDSRAQRGFCPWRSGHYSTLMPEIPLLHVDGNLSKLQENTETLSAISIQHRRRQHFGFCLPCRRSGQTLSRSVGGRNTWPRCVCCYVLTVCSLLPSWENSGAACLKENSAQVIAHANRKGKR